MAWKPWQLDNPPMQGPEVAAIQRRALHAFGSYAIPLGVRESGIYDKATADFVAEFQRRAGLKPTGIADYATKLRLGVVKTPTPKQLIPIMTVPGTVSWWNDGPPAWTAWKCDPKRFRQQGVGFSTDAFLMGDASHSYINARDEGTAELLRLSWEPGPKVWVGYSLGADIVVRALWAWPVERRAEIICVITFGSPGRPPGPTLLGSDPGGAGIAGVYTPGWAQDREYSFALPGDMYPEAVGFLPALYELLTRLEASGEFAMYLFQLLLSSLGGPLLGMVTSVIPGAGALSGLLPILGLGSQPAGGGAAGGLLGGFGDLGGMIGGLGGLLGGGQTGVIGGVPGNAPQLNLLSILTNIPAIIQTLMAALRFLMTNAHYHYHDQPAFNGLTGVDRAAQIINAI